MFKQSISDKQTYLFSSVASNLTGNAKKLYDDKKAWNNLSRRQILQRIDKTPYQVLYSNRMGAPNASVSMLKPAILSVPDTHFMFISHICIKKQPVFESIIFMFVLVNVQPL